MIRAQPGFMPIKARSAPSQPRDEEAVEPALLRKRAGQEAERAVLARHCALGQFAGGYRRDLEFGMLGKEAGDGNCVD